MLRSTFFSSATSAGLSIFKPAASLMLTILATCFMISSAYADNYFSGDTLFTYDNGRQFRDGDKFVVVHPQGVPKKPEFDNLNENYLGNTGRRGTYVAGDPYRYYTILPGYQKRHRVFKLVTSSDKSGSRSSRVDLVFNSKEDASNFCGYLLEVAQASLLNPFNEKYTSVHVSDGVLLQKAIAVPYWIAYGKDSHAAADGTSMPAQKHVMCPNNLGEPLNPNFDDENERTGIQKSELDSSGDFYDVECVNSSKPVTSFRWSNEHLKWMNESGYSGGTSKNMTLHQLNEQVGARYCDAR